MTWTATDLGVQADINEAMRSCLDSASMPSGWEVATPASQANARNFRLNISGKNPVLNMSYLYFFKSHIYAKISGSYQSNAGAATWDQVVYTGSGGMQLSGATGINYKLWTTDEVGNNSLALIGSNGNIVWLYVDFDTYITGGSETFTPNTANAQILQTVPMGWSGSGTSAHAGPPYNSSMDVGSYAFMACDLDMTNPGSTNTLMNMQGKVIQGWRGQALAGASNSSDREWPIGVCNSPNLLVHLGASDGGNLGMTNNNPAIKVTDGTNWYIRSNSDLTASAFLLPCGTSEFFF